MAKLYKIPDFRRLYPEASEEVISVLRTTERKMQYQEYDLKRERIEVNQETQSIIRTPSKEDSYERLLEQDMQFGGDAPSVEEQVINHIQAEQLHRAIAHLSEDERYLVEQLYFQEKTEREIAKELGLYHNAIHVRKKAALEKLRNFLKKF